MIYDDFKTANYPQALLSPELFARHLSRLFVGDVIDGLTVTPGTGLQVVLAPGNAFVRYGSANVASARFVSLVANFNLTIATPDASNPRIDLVVLYTDNAVTLPGGTPSSANLDGKGVSKAKIVQGTPAATPVAPNDTAIQASVGAGNPYTVLAQVRVDQGVSVIAANKITDVRALVGQQSWQSWTPTFTGITGGALVYARYIKIGKTVHYRLEYQMTGANVSGSVTFSLPVPIISGLDTTSPIGFGSILDSGTALFSAQVLAASTTAGQIRYLRYTNGILTPLSANDPMTWAAGDKIMVSGTYEAA